jgi:hypothetical protein
MSIVRLHHRHTDGRVEDDFLRRNHWPRLLIESVARALALALPSADNNMLARRAMMATSITSSINVNPGRNLTRDHEPEHCGVTILTNEDEWFVGTTRHSSGRIQLRQWRTSSASISRVYEFHTAFHEPPAPVTPTFQSASFAGWKIGVTNLGRFMVPRRAKKRNEALPEPLPKDKSRFLGATHNS